MRTLVNMNPIAELQEMADWFERVFNENRPSTALNPPSQQSFVLPIDIFEKDGRILVKAAVAGVPPEDVEITIEDGVLTIRGETKAEQETEGSKVYRREYRYGAFSRSIRLPEDADTDAVEASFENGMVAVSIPRREPIKPKQVRVPIKGVQNAGSPAIEANSPEPDGEKRNGTANKN